VKRVRSVLASPLVALQVVAVVSYLLMVAFAPELLLRMLAHEGPVEHVGHLVLLLALLAWLVLAECCIVMDGVRFGATALPMIVTICLVFLFLEDIDWGAVYGVDLGYSLVRELTGGSSNFHDAMDGSELLAGVLLWMLLPLVLVFSVGLIPLRGLRARWDRLAPVRPTWDESVRFWLIGVLALVTSSVDLLPEREPGAAPASALTFFEIACFALWASVALRATRALFQRRPLSSAFPRSQAPRHPLSSSQPGSGSGPESGP